MTSHRIPERCRFREGCIFRHVDDDSSPDQVKTEHVSPEYALVGEKYEQEVPEKLDWDSLYNTATVETGITHSSEGEYYSCEGGWRDGTQDYFDGSNEEEGEEEGEEDDEEEEEGDEEEDSSLWSDNSEQTKTKWEIWKAEKNDRTKPEITEAVCGECGAKFNSEDAFELLRAHYLEQFKKFNFQHLKFLSKHERFEHTTCCMICDKLFGRSKDLLRHIVDKSKQQTEDGEEHHVFLDVGLVLTFCYHDTVDHDEEKLMEELFLSLVHTYNGSDTDSEDEDFLNFMGLAHMLTKMPHAHILNMGAGDSDDDSDDDGVIFGFSEDDCYELACQGIKPWDPEAGATLAVLNGCYDY